MCVCVYVCMCAIYIERGIVRIKMGVGGKVGLNPIELSRSRFRHYSSPGQAMPGRKGLDAHNTKRYA